jgi:2'-5' RNA ligase
MTTGAIADPTGRLFLAVTPPPDALAELIAARKAFQAAGVPPLRWVDGNRMHLTLQFLGETRLSETPLIEAAMREAMAEMPSLKLTLAGWGLFNGKHRRAGTARQDSAPEPAPRVLWAGIGGDVHELTGCAVRLGAALAARGIPSDRRPFRPHITLARVPRNASQAERDALLAAVRQMPIPSSVAFQVAELHLIQSLLAQPPRYRILGSVEFPGA